MARRQRRSGPLDVLLLLEQTEAWVGDDGGAVAVTELSMLERARLVRALRARARVAWLSSLLRRELGEAHAAHMDGETAETWIEARPLVRRLLELNRSSPCSAAGAGAGWVYGERRDAPVRPSPAVPQPLTAPAMPPREGAAAPRGR